MRGFLRIAPRMLARDLRDAWLGLRLLLWGRWR